MGTTNYTSTFIQVAEDCPALEAQVPPGGGKAPSVAELQHQLISEHPYELTSDDVLFEVYAIRNDIATTDKAEAREAFFAKLAGLPESFAARQALRLGRALER